MDSLAAHFTFSSLSLIAKIYFILCQILFVAGVYYFARTISNSTEAPEDGNKEPVAE
jgi:hypothetical protein